MRSLLDTREHCLNEFNFPDPYSKVSTAFSWVSGCMLMGRCGVLATGCTLESPW